MIPLRLRYGERANHKHFRREDNEWNLGLVFDREMEVINSYLSEQAKEHWYKFKSVKAEEHWEALQKNIEATYAKEEEMPPVRIYSAARNGSLQHEAPPKEKIRTMTILLVLSVIAESTVVVIQQAFAGDFNPFIFMIAFLLALGGVLQGLGIGNFLVRHWKQDTGRPQSDRPLIHWIAIGVGTLLILFVAALRGGSAFDPSRMLLVFALTLLLGEAVAFFEAQREKYKAMRATVLSEMLQAQQWEANELHRKHLANNGYFTTYEAALRR